MASPAILGDLGYQIACLPANTSTSAWMNVQAGTDTGTVSATGYELDLSRPLGKSTTGGKPLDATINPLSRQRRQYRSVGIAVPIEMTFHSSGKHIIIRVVHYQRSATSGAGSTAAAIKTEDFKFKMGTDTDATIFHGFVSTVNAQAIQRYYKAVVSVRRRLATSTAAKDTTTDSGYVVNSPVYILGGADQFRAQV